MNRRSRRTVTRADTRRTRVESMGRITFQNPTALPRGNDGLMESEENMKPFPSLPTVLGIDKERRFPHYAPHDDEYGLINQRHQQRDLY